jgi:hypothetical protein
MNSPTFLQRFALCARIIVMCGAGMLLPSTLQAQLGMSGVNSRFLLIFDTSSAMKARVPATQYAVERLFFSMMNGQLQSGDTIGVWTFDRTLRKGGFPLQGWLPQNAAMIASNITNYVRLRHYSKSTRFDMLMPEVNGLVQNSERLTVLIFCDGDGAIKGTPYDNAINSVFKQNESALKKADQTFVVVLRAQFGQYTGYTVNSSAVGVNFPDFPPLPQPPQPIAPAKTNLPPPPPPTPVVTAPPLVIVGTNVGTNLLPAIPARSVLSNPPPVKVESNLPPVESLSTPTNASSTNATPPKMAESQTNAPASSEENSGLSRNGALAIGAVLLAVAVVVIIVALVRSRRRGRGSLITRSMK